MIRVYNQAVELRHLRYFTAIAENGGIGRAARLLHVAQSAISEQIRDLESELGVALFDRRKRRIRLTYHGQQFLEDARAVLAAADRATANVRKSIRGEVGTLTIGFFVGGTGTFFSGIIREFRRRFQDVHLSLVEMAPGMQHRALETGAIDVAFTRPVQPAYATLLRSEHFKSEPFYVVLPHTHPLAAKRRIHLRELAHELFILNDRSHSPATFDKIITLCAEAGFSPRIGSTATVAFGVIALVEAGEGIAILPEGSKRLRSSDEVLYIPLADRGAFIDLVIAWSPEHENPVLGSFLELARKRR
jgi:DNA-binding transcriptional LysR family regulator